MEAAVIGAGSWGTALAFLLANRGFNVYLWMRNSELYKEMKLKRCNTYYLPEVKLPPEVKPTLDLEEAVKGKKYVFLVVPSHALRETIFRLRTYLESSVLLVNAAKGLETSTNMRLSGVIEEEMGDFPGYRLAVISGPNHAEEVSRQIPSATVAASNCEETAREVQELLMTPYFRVYTNSDLVGVEMGGALKNIISLGSGIVEGLQLGDNTRAALITRGLVEIIRLGNAVGAKGRTFTGLAGLGDLFVTCYSRHSRNLKVGIQLGEGRKLRDILSDMSMIAEGVNTTKAAYHLSREKEVEMPITEEIYYITSYDKDPRRALKDLMKREKKEEVEDIAFDE